MRQTNRVLSKMSLIQIILIGIASLFFSGQLPHTTHAQNLRPQYEGNDGGVYYVRQMGNRVFWFGEKEDGSFANVLVGTRSGNRISAAWWDIPRGRTQGNGQIQLEIQGGGTTIIKRSATGGFGGSRWTLPNTARTMTAILPPSRRSPGYSGGERNLTGVWEGNDYGVYYVREFNNTVVWFGEYGISDARKPIFANVFIGRKNGNRITGSWVDIPKGTTRGNGALTLQISSPQKMGRMSGGGFGGSLWYRSTPKKLRGFVDMHTHPMSHLGFGMKALHGVPDIGSLIPAGMRACNNKPFRAATIEQALGDCNATHGGWGTDNGCGNYIRAAIINFAVDSDFKHKSDNPHGDHHHPGYPNFAYWPHQTSKLHQQMWVDWLRRAYDGGLRVMVGLAVNNELLAEILDGDNPKDDKTSADIQIDEMIAFVGRHQDFMEIARSPADLRRIVAANKLAVVLGIEVDNIGNFHKPGVRADENTVRNEIRRLYDKGVRYVFPIHLVDNKFGGAAVYDMLFNVANKYTTGSFFQVETSPDRTIRYSMSLFDTEGPFAAENALIFGVRGILEGLGRLPSPCMNDISCMPPPGKLSCCSQFATIKNILTPTPDLDVYKFIRAGHVNKKGLTPLGEFAIREMMGLGMLIDIDHMSEKSMIRSIELAEEYAKGVPGDEYPLNMGHNDIRGGAEGSERNVTPQLVGRISKLGGMFGVGTSDTDPRQFVANFNAAWTAMQFRATAIGTDVNGFEPLPRTGRSQSSNAFYQGFTKSRTAGKEWDYIQEGVAHYGLMVDFLREVARQPSPPGGGVRERGAMVVENLFESAEYFAQMWEKATGVRGVKKPALPNLRLKMPPPVRLTP